MGAPSSIARTLVLMLVVLLTACAVGGDPEGMQLLSVVDPNAGELTGTTTDFGSSEDGLGGKTGATPLDASDGTDVDDETTAGGDSFGSSTDGDSDGQESTTTAEPEPQPQPQPEPQGSPMYEPCVDGTECEGGVCVRLVAEGGTELGSYCSAACENPAADCDIPTGSADPLCLVLDTSVVCGLECTGGQSCPAGMSCFAFTTGDYCF